MSFKRKPTDKTGSDKYAKQTAQHGTVVTKRSIATKKTNDVKK